jgi:protein-L-isoaspartate O-methyltransferase
VIHEAAARGFAQAADAYEHGRPGYPPEAVERLCEAVGIGPGRAVLDLAAGTGKLTRLLVPTGRSSSRSSRSSRCALRWRAPFPR